MPLFPKASDCFPFLMSLWHVLLTNLFLCEYLSVCTDNTDMCVWERSAPSQSSLQLCSLCSGPEVFQCGSGSRRIKAVSRHAAQCSFLSASLLSSHFLSHFGAGCLNMSCASLGSGSFHSVAACLCGWLGSLLHQSSAEGFCSVLWPTSRAPRQRDYWLQWKGKRRKRLGLVFTTGLIWLGVFYVCPSGNRLANTATNKPALSLLTLNTQRCRSNV